MTLRGIEGLIADKYLERVALGNDMSVLNDYFEAKYMAIQVYFQCRGKGL